MHEKYVPKVCTAILPSQMATDTGSAFRIFLKYTGSAFRILLKYLHPTSIIKNEIEEFKTVVQSIAFGAYNLLH